MVEWYMAAYLACFTVAIAATVYLLFFYDWEDDDE